MTDDAIIPEIVTPTQEENSAARVLLERVDSLLDKAREKEHELRCGYVEIGLALLEVEETKAWLVGGYHSVGDYLKYAGDRLGRRKSSLYGYTDVARKLLPHVSAEKLNSMGIIDASLLAKYLKETGRVPPAELIELALDPKVRGDEFKAAVYTAMHAQPEDAGKWHDLGGFYATDEEWAEITRTCCLPVGKDKFSDLTWQDKKAAYLAMARECYVEWSQPA